MLVLSTISVAELDKIATATALTRLEYRLNLLTVTEGDLDDSSEVFPTKFLDIRRYHETLFGREHAKDLQIPRDRLQRQARRQLMNLRLRLRQAYLDSSGRPEQLGGVVRRSITTLFLHLGILLELSTGKPVASSMEILGLAPGAGLDRAGLTELRDFKRNRPALTSAELIAVYEKLTRHVEAALKMSEAREVSLDEFPPA